MKPIFAIAANAGIRSFEEDLDLGFAQGGMVKGLLTAC
jgi:hypothetical protein